MKILPTSGSGWLEAALIPFKAFVPLGYLIVVIQRQRLGYRMDSGEITPFVLFGYIVTGLGGERSGGNDERREPTRYRRKCLTHI